MGVQQAGFAVLAGLLSGVVPLTLMMQVPDVGRSPGWLLTLAVIIWAGIRLTARVVSGRPALFDFVFWLFTYIFMGLAPTVQIRTDLPSTTTPGMMPDADVPTALVVWAGIVAYEAGRAWAGRRLRRDSPGGRHPSWGPEQLSTDQLSGDDIAGFPGVSVARAALLACVGLVAAAYFTSRIGLPTLFMSRYSAFAIRSEIFPDVATRSIIMAAATYPLLIAAGVFARGFSFTPAVRRLCLIGIVVTVPVLLIMSNPISSARYEAGTVFFALAVLCGAMSSTLRARISMVAVVVAFLLVFPLADAFRTDTVRLGRDGFYDEYAANPDYDAFWQVGNALSYLEEVGLQPGNQLLGVVFFWVPRSIWPGKAIDTGSLLAQYRGYNFDNLSSPLWAELLMNGSIPALLLGFLGVGVLLARLDSRIGPALLGRDPWWAIVGAVLPFYMVILLRGSLLQATGSLVVSVACLLWVRGRRPPHMAPGGTQAT